MTSIFGQSRWQRFASFVGLSYIALISLLLVPVVQNHVLFMHVLKWPLFADFEHPAKYGMSATRTLNVRVHTSDNVSLGGWFMFPRYFLSSNSFQLDSVSDLTTSPLSNTSAPEPVDPQTPFSILDTPTLNSGITREQLLQTSLANHPTILFFHGNAATRAVGYRTRIVRSLSSAFGVKGANVLMIDYRGYADSTKRVNNDGPPVSPSKDGLILDGIAAWDWVVSRGADPQNIILVGHSLGTAVVAGTAAKLAERDVHPRGIVLLAPFTSVVEILDNYSFFGVLPIMQPLKSFPFVLNFLRRSIRNNFDTKALISKIQCPILIAHATSDAEVAVWHSHALFDTLLEPLLPALPPLPLAGNDPQSESTQGDAFANHMNIIESRNQIKSDIVHVGSIDGGEFGSVAWFERPVTRGKEQGGTEPTAKVVFVESKWGGHVYIGEQDGVWDVASEVFGL